MSARLEWRTVTDSRSPRFFVKGTPLAEAFFLSHRFRIVEVRGGSNGDGSYADRYRAYDAETVTLAEVKDGKQPLCVGSWPVVEFDEMIADLSSM